MIDIHHIDDILPAIQGRGEFMHKVDEIEGYQVIDYRYLEPDTFNIHPDVSKVCPIRQECRGIKFDLDGNLIARPLHKFFNVNERVETAAEDLDWESPHYIQEKLDGSMIHPVLVNKKVRLMTRKGLSDVALWCEQRYLEEKYREFKWIIEDGYTPIFEWVSPANRIVVEYFNCRLVLLTVRHNESGRYMPRTWVDRLAELYGFDRPKILATQETGNWHALEKHCGDLEDEEGFVVWFESGPVKAVKVKAPWYVTRHRAIDQTQSEHHVIELILSRSLDDVLPLVNEEHRTRLLRLNSDVWAAINLWGGRLEGMAVAAASRKSFALEVNELVPKPIRSAAFQIWDGEPMEKSMKAAIRRHLTALNKARDMLAALDIQSLN